MSYKTTQPSWCRREASALDAGKIQCSLGSGKFGQLLPDYLGELFPAHLFLLPRVDDPEFDNALLDLGGAEDHRQRDPVLLAVLQLVQHLWRLLVRLFSLR